MFESPVKIRSLILFFFFSLTIIVFCIFSSIFDDRTKIVFCNVGQGDAAYIRINNKIDVLIDAGPDKSVLLCLGKYMPFWDRKIELAFLSHPNIDHYGGYQYITYRYKIDKFITVKSPFTNNSYKKLLSELSVKKIPLSSLISGDRFIAGNGLFKAYWPLKNFNSSNDNDFSSVILFECCKDGSRPAQTILFTGDASPFVLSRLSNGSLGKISILKVPHHGSKNGLTKKFLDLADPTVAVISVGKNNSYGHPNKQTLDMLKAKNIKILRTDEEKDIVFNLKE
ncbi:MAG: hypothetical protein WC741_02990 [Patescibacteria group bacterium]|jgi:beta-lactamase superfamily II metal-dependent hydrolase